MGATNDYMQKLLMMQQMSQPLLGPNVNVGQVPAQQQVQTPAQQPQQQPNLGPDANIFNVDNPLSRMALLQAGLQALQPVQPGQSDLGHVAGALSGGLQRLNELRSQERTAGLEERQVGVQEQQAGTGDRRVDVAERKLDQQRDQFSEEMDLRIKELGVDENYKKALARYYDRLGRAAEIEASGQGRIDPNDLDETARKMAEAEWENLVSSGMSADELQQFYPGGIGGLTQRYRLQLSQTPVGLSPEELKEQQLAYAQEFGINPVSGLPVPGQKGQGEARKPPSEPRPGLGELYTRTIGPHAYLTQQEQEALQNIQRLRAGPGSPTFSVHSGNQGVDPAKVSREEAQALLQKYSADLGLREDIQAQVDAMLQQLKNYHRL